MVPTLLHLPCFDITGVGASSACIVSLVPTIWIHTEWPSQTFLFKTNPPSTSGYFNYVRCLRSSLGSSPRICKNSGFWRSYQFSWHINKKELEAAFLALKFLIPNQTNVHVQICIDNRAAVAYINHLGGTRSLELNSIAVKMWAWCLERNMFLSALYVPGILNKIADLLSCLKLESTEWMLNLRIFKQIVNVYRMPVLDMFASALYHQVPKYFSWTLDPQAVGMDTFSVNWNKGLLYMFPLFSLIQKCLRKIIEDNGTVLLITPVPHNLQILKLPWSQTIYPRIQNRKFRLAVWPFSGDLLRTKSFQKGCAKYYRPHGNPVQENSIKSAWKQFFSWCSQRSCDPFPCSLNII